MNYDITIKKRAVQALANLLSEDYQRVRDGITDLILKGNTHIYKNLTKFDSLGQIN